MRKSLIVAFLHFISAIDTIRFAGVASFNPQGDQITLEEASVSKNILLPPNAFGGFDFPQHKMVGIDRLLKRL